MAGLEKTLLVIKNINRERGQYNVTVPMLMLTLSYLIAVLSVPLFQPQRLIWLMAYPIVFAEFFGFGFLKIFLKSLWILPIVIFIGMFNPIFEPEEAFVIDTISISVGWISFFSIILRGLIAFQAILILVNVAGFIDLFNALHKIGCPKVLVTQLQLTYRYISVIIEEALVMKRAREARGFGKISYPLSMWSQFVGQLLIRSTQRSTRIHRAMLARGFNGILPTSSPISWTNSSFILLVGGIFFISLLRFVDFSELFHSLINNLNTKP